MPIRSTTVLLLAAGLAHADTINCPTASNTTGGSGAYSTILHAQARSYQVVIGPTHLPALPPNTAARITSIRWRIASWQAFAAWPPVAATFANFDVTFSKSNFPAGSLSTTYTNNIGPDAVVTRAGPITFGAGMFPGGAVSPAFNAFGPAITFAQTYLYTRGDLLITIRHTGNGVSNGNLDWIAGAGCQAIGVSSYTQPDNWYAQGNGGALACQLEYTLEPLTTSCYANCDGSTATPILNVNDFICFQNAFAAGNVSANCDGSTTPPTLNVNDFICFQNAFAAGCS
ncbi:MAG: GC-type dockerin domain-anchored protein [Phycisphaerales bacterium]